tara:strand:- start:77 stop:280 length:204 start_codon:yes stop_codon:yes gene_type:complete
MNFRIGDKAHHFMRGNKVGKVVDIKYDKQNIPWSTGGSFEHKIYIILEYPDKSKESVLKSDLIKIFD